MEAKQIAFLLVAMILGAGVVFVVGFQAGVHIDAAEIVDAPLAGGGATARLPGHGERSERFSFFDELRTPAAPAPIRKLSSPEGNANNTPELAKAAEKRRQREARRQEWAKAATKEIDAEPRKKPLAVRSIDRAQDTDRPRVRTIAEHTPDADKVRTLDPASEEPAESSPRVRTIEESPKVRTLDAAPSAQVRAVPRDGEFTLQFGSYANEGEAERVMQRVRGVGQARVVQASGPDGGKVYRVRLGRFDSLEDAHQAQQQVRSKEGVHAFVTPL